MSGLDDCMFGSIRRECLDHVVVFGEAHLRRILRSYARYYIRSGANTPGRAGRPIEHPGRNLQPSPGCPTREAATENLSASLLNHLMNMDQASGPRMPRIKKLVLRDPVGVPSSCCTMTSGRTGHWKKVYQSLVKFSESEASNHTPSLGGLHHHYARA